MADYTRSTKRLPSDDEENDAGCLRRSGGDSSAVETLSGGAGSSTRKPRGRPPGSKNKPKPPVVITRENESAMHPVVLEIAAGSDVLDCIAAFVRRRRVGVSILGGSGAVANVGLRQPASSPSTFSISGRFDILSLSGTFLPPPNGGGGAIPAAAFTISLAGGRGEVIGGAVAGPLTAAGNVVVVGASFHAAEFLRLPEAAAEEEDRGTEDYGDVKPLTLPLPTDAAAAAGVGKQLTGQLPHEHMALWAAPASSRSSCSPHLRPPPHY
ncbi:Putative DNA-binding protein ESCAROLA [Apostasia shenzhenica]|uniref:DNA-binding protein ESCAROLA n=1 Tax=Apostasia shenzhenica TaxID=1088818 RepID=A0A2I0AIP5_9ASPA|nr:Putative DNA-binding protein ESCAROLA [Apostasia shenzhenica]